MAFICSNWDALVINGVNDLECAIGMWIID